VVGLQGDTHSCGVTIKVTVDCLDGTGGGLNPDERTCGHRFVFLMR
jgi:hypothetical protein